MKLISDDVRDFFLECDRSDRRRFAAIGDEIFAREDLEMMQLAPHCDRIDCHTPAIGAVGIALYPSHDQDAKPISRMVLGVKVCEQHFREIQESGPTSIVKADHLEAFTALIERMHGQRVDRTATQVQRVAFTDRDYLALHGRGQAHN